MHSTAGQDSWTDTLAGASLRLHATSTATPHCMAPGTWDSPDGLLKLHLPESAAASS